MRKMSAKCIFICVLLIIPYCKSNADDDDENYLMKYLQALDDVVQFADEHRNFIGFNLGFGLFLAQVNLKTALEKSDFLPKSVSAFVLRIAYELDRPLKYFKSQVSQHDKIRKGIISLLSDSSWTKRVKEYNNAVLIKFLEKFDLPKRENWENYYKNATAPDVTEKNPEQSDMCLASLSENPVNSRRYMNKCYMNQGCYKILSNGTQFGYALTRRLQMILMARMGRGCYLFSRNRDETTIHKMCALAFKEADYIAENDYKLIDLMMEQVSFCSLNGYSEFIQHIWMSKILKHQKSSGCFASSSSEECNEHMTGVGASTLAAAIRFLCQLLY